MTTLFRRGSIYRQRGIVALTLTAVAVGTWLLMPSTLSMNWIVASFFMVLALQFAYDVYCQPLPMDEPWAVKFFDWLRRKWDYYSRPAIVDTFQDKTVLARWEFCDFRTIYDARGWVTHTEQTINWSDTDMDWRFNMPEDIQVINTKVDDGSRLPWLARWRSPKLTG